MAVVHLEDNIRLPQTYRIIFGGNTAFLSSLHRHPLNSSLGSHDNGYVNVLRSVITAGFRDKLILIPGYTDVAVDIKALMLPELRIPNLFMTTKLVSPSYMSIASGPPPGLPATPRLAAAAPQVSSPPGLGQGDVSRVGARRDSIPSYKTALQSGRNDSLLYEASDSSVSTDASEAQPAQPVQFMRRVSSPGKQRRVNPKLVESTILP